MYQMGMQPTSFSQENKSQGQNAKVKNKADL